MKNEIGASEFENEFIERDIEDEINIEILIEENFCEFFHNYVLLLCMSCLFIR